MLSLLLALLAGVVTIAAPCTLPVLPILLGASLGTASTARPVFIALGFVISFAVVALALGAIASVFDFDPNVLRDSATLLLVGFGVLMIWPAPLDRLAMHLRGRFATGAKPASHQGNLGGFLLGTTLGLVWSPCAGPVLGSILTLIATSKSPIWAGAQLLAYAIGAALPMLAIAYGGQRITSRVRGLARIAPRLQQGFGVVVIVFAAATYLHYDTAVVAWLTQFYPEGFVAL